MTPVASALAALVAVGPCAGTDARRVRRAKARANVRGMVAAYETAPDARGAEARADAGARLLDDAREERGEVVTL